jgi:hypothetical protein
MVQAVNGGGRFMPNMYVNRTSREAWREEMRADFLHTARQGAIQPGAGAEASPGRIPPKGSLLNVTV